MNKTVIVSFVLGMASGCALLVGLTTPAAAQLPPAPPVDLNHRCKLVIAQTGTIGVEVSRAVNDGFKVDAAGQFTAQSGGGMWALVCS